MKPIARSECANEMTTPPMYQGPVSILRTYEGIEQRRAPVSQSRRPLEENTSGKLCSPPSPKTTESRGIFVVWIRVFTSSWELRYPRPKAPRFIQSRRRHWLRLTTTRLPSRSTSRCDSIRSSPQSSFQSVRSHPRNSPTRRKKDLHQSITRLTEIFPK